MTRALDLPRIIGHRGAAGHAPENTLAGLRKARALGCTWVEVDVRATGDGVPVLLHDATLERTTDGVGRLDTSSYERLRAYDAGSWHDERFRGEPVPTLETALAEAAALSLGVDLEIKPTARPEPLIDSIGRAIARAWPARAPPPLLSSFDADIMAALPRRLPHLPRAVLADSIDQPALSLARRVGAVAIGTNQKYLSATTIAATRQSGFAVFAYTVNDRDRAAELLSAGVVSLVSDYPDRLAGLA